MRSFISSVKYLPAILFWLIIWHIVSVFVANSIVLVSPLETFTALIRLLFLSSFWGSITFSITRIVLGFLLALFAGIVLAAISARLKFFYILLLPAINTIKSIPVASFTILALWWVQASNLSIFIAFVTVLPIVFFNTYEGIKNINTKLLEMAEIFRIKHYKKTLHIYAPAVIPHIVSACASGLGFAFKAGVAAELIGLIDNSIGRNLHTARIFLETADLLAWTITIVILSFIMEKIIHFCLKRILLWL